LQRNFNFPKIVRIEKVIQETPTVRTLIFSDEVFSNALPGQFGMVWVPGINELPMSIMISEDRKKPAFTIRKKGTASTGLYNVGVGDPIGIRGPYGNSFDRKNGNLLLVGGGTGLVPLMRLLSGIRLADDITIVMGSISKNEVFFENLAKQILGKNKHQIIIATEDGSAGEKGLVTDILERKITEKKFDGVYTCGPELMMYKTVKWATSKGLFVQASRERMMKCGLGISFSSAIAPERVPWVGFV